jgi:TPR repeat protein
MFAQTKDNFDSELILARQGDAGAQNDIGIMLAEGRGVRRDDREAVFWFKKSAEQGHVLGACNLALHYARGQGIPKKPVLALKWAFISHSLDGLKCFPDDFLEYFKPSKAQFKRAWTLADTFLKSHPNLTNEFGETPWLKGKAQQNKSFNPTPR